MEENNQDQNFVFGSDDTDTYHDHTQNHRIDKLNQKVTLLSILIPSIIGIIFVFLYMDMKNKVVQVHDSGASEVQKTADELKKSMQDLQTANVEFEKILDGKIAALEKKLVPVNDKINKIEKDIASLSSIKIDKKTLDAQIKTVTDANEALKKDLAGLTAQTEKVVTIAQELQVRTKDIPTITTTQESLKNTIASLKNDMADKNDLATELKKQKVFYKLEIQDLATKIDKKIQSLKTVTPPRGDSVAGPQ